MTPTPSTATLNPSFADPVECATSNETDARIIIDRLLREADWDIEDKAQVSMEEATADSRADYVLKDWRSRPLTVIEAKRIALTRCKPRQAPSARPNSQRKRN